MGHLYHTHSLRLRDHPRRGDRKIVRGWGGLEQNSVSWTWWASYAHKHTAAVVACRNLHRIKSINILAWSEEGLRAPLTKELLTSSGFWGIEGCFVYFKRITSCRSTTLPHPGVCGYHKLDLVGCSKQKTWGEQGETLVGMLQTNKRTWSWSWEGLRR